MILYSACYNEYYPFRDLVDRAELVRWPSDLKSNKGVLLLWGGEDISPYIYSESVGSFTRAPAIPSVRDKCEVALIHEAIDIGMPIVAICRGAQLVCAVLGGKVIQHVNHHGQEHGIHTSDKQHLVTSSLHHQMMYPWNIEHELIAWTEQLSKTYLDGSDQEYSFPEQAYQNNILLEPEIVYFPQARCLAIQGHPEFMSFDDMFVQYCRTLFKSRCYATNT